jgi:hypothetical protein
MSQTKKRLGVVASMLAVLLLGGGVAFAYWTTTGGGTGNASVGTDVHVTVAQTAVSGLVPGGPAVPLDFTVTNPGTGPETISGVNVVVAVSAHPNGACSASDFVVTQPNIGGASEIYAGDAAAFDSVDTGAAISMTDTGSNQDGCKGATLQLTYTVS